MIRQGKCFSLSRTSCFVEQRDFVSMNYRTGFQSESLHVENIFFLSRSDIESDFVPIRSPLIIISRKFRWPVAAFRRFRTGRRTVSIIGICSRSSRRNQKRRRIHVPSKRFVSFVPYRSKLVFGAICFNIREARQITNIRFDELFEKSINISCCS